MADRKVPTSASTPPVGGPAYLDEVAEKFGLLFNAVALKPTAIVNAGNDYTITVDPELDGDVVAGMGFYVQPNVSNTDACRLRATADNPYYDLVKATGDPLGPGDFDADTVYFVVFFGGDFRILSVAASGGGGGGATISYQEFTASGTWVKPTGLGSEAIAIVECWGAGGGGATGNHRQGGGGGGGYNRAVIKLADLADNEAVTVGAGGAPGNPGGVGGTTSFGSHVFAYGGGGGATNTNSSGVGGGSGGGGGGQISAGTSGTPTSGTSGPTPGAGGIIGGGAGASAAVGIWGGGGGANVGGAMGGGTGGASLFGGAGGGGHHNGGGSEGTGGTSVYGGSGGNGLQAGNPPGGGGGAQAVGARGEVRVRVIG
ncbi:hypothetical protein H2509_04145 [Stappia sp. F7233]|uniref:Uncharacterized protein n=1 Tax=Stappia albiluteola TaxID=2758565 RepID=A0A839A9T9_9HYPH|nr:hypothetical protein [Stappia albiluteola]MBA5776296.1 hypothetical protein [Stappia albiluteola]MBA5776313.1 hypothetical protein [Stappia albiluteola]